MSGHNKWAQIRHKKAVTDAARSRVFARFARLIAVESKKTGGDTRDPSLATAIARAKAANMPKDNIERAIAKGAAKDAASFESVVYEAYGPEGAALIISALTDNKNRTTQEIKHLLSKNGVELAAPGAASWAFTKNQSGVYVPREPLVALSAGESEKFENILSAIDEHDDVQAVYTNAHGYESSEST